MSYQIKVITPVTQADEPLTLDQIKATCRIDLDSAYEDDELWIIASAARGRLEKHLNIGLAPVTLEVQWSGCKMELPFSPTIEVLSVTGLDDEAVEYKTDGYQAKSIWINGNSAVNGTWEYWPSSGYVDFTPDGYNEQVVYKCVYRTGYETLPNDLRNGLMQEIAQLYLLRGQPVTNLISPNAAMMVKSYSRNLVL